METRIAARSTTFESLTALQATDFIQKYHRSGAIVSAGSKTLSVGLFFNQELVAVAQFCAPRTARMKREYSSELLRLAFQDEVRVIGGASKLLENYRKRYNPSDIFTYQDTTGEVTSVYEAAGFTLVRQAKSKQYLVAFGKRLASAKRGEYYSMAQVVARGPDALLGVKLGEVFRADGKRKTNPELFVEELGWHMEETSGDRVYEWVNPDRTFYTYKITAADSDKYYFGVSHVKKANATFEECLHDGYFGSGGGMSSGNKFSNWKKRHSTLLKKEILELFDRQSRAYESEKKLVGKLYKEDLKCLNSTTGGKDGGLRMQKSLAAGVMAECSHHGLVYHQGEVCSTCNALKRFSLRECSIHGVVKHSGAHCVSCLSAKTYAEGECEVHGLTIHKTGRCVRCSNEASVTEKNCSIHGLTKHIGKQCYRCISLDSKVYEKRICPKHGEATFRGDSCAKCSAQSVFTDELCPTHGVAKHRKGVCQKCKNAASVSMKECPTHGVTKHQGTTCGLCSGEKVRHGRSHKLVKSADCRFCSE